MDWWTNSASLPSSASSRFGPTAPVLPAASNVWQPAQPFDAKSAFPAAGSPACASSSVVVAVLVVSVCPVSVSAGPVSVSVGPVSVSVSSVSTWPAASAPSSSAAKTTTAPSIPTVSSNVTTMKRPRPLRPGKSGRYRGISSAVTSAKPMKTAAVPARPSFWSVVSPRSTTGTYRSRSLGPPDVSTLLWQLRHRASAASTDWLRGGEHSAAREELDAGRGANFTGVHERVAATLECRALRSRQERGLRAGVDSVPLARARIGDRLRKRHAEIDAIEEHLKHGRDDRRAAR